MKKVILNKVGGLTLIEASLGVLVFFTLLFGVIDFAIYSLVSATLTKRARDAVNVASVAAGFERSWANTADQEAESAFNQYHAALLLTDQRSVSLPGVVPIGQSGSGSWAEYEAVNIELPSYTFQGGLTTPLHSSINTALLRPGETASIGNSQISNGDPQVQANRDMLSLLREFPIIAEQRARVRTILPFLGPLEARGRAVAFRELASPYSDPAGLPLSSELPPPSNSGGGSGNNGSGRPDTGACAQQDLRAACEQVLQQLQQNGDDRFAEGNYNVNPVPSCGSGFLCFVCGEGCTNVNSQCNWCWAIPAAS
ncbi:MAG: hypothetical protein DCC75_07130 [Proteobacteria bacterium]|nr:MAG: hypothetical protein DCC75_07130 [Pseudomonadota bacterium]